MRIEMKKFFWILAGMLSICLFVVTVGMLPGFGAEQNLPVVKGKKIVASVNEELIPLDDFNKELRMLHQGATEEKRGGKRDPLDLLNRMINTRLIIQEARRMELHELKEIKERVEVFAKVTLRDELIERRVRDIKPDEQEVEKVYKESIKEWKIKSILFEKEENAKKMEDEIKGGKNFDEVLKKFLSAKLGKGSQEAGYLKNKDLLPPVAQAVSKMKVGRVSPIIPIKAGFVILKLEDVRSADDPKVREQVRLEVLRKQQKEAVIQFDKSLQRKYVKVNEGLLKRLDFESKEPGFDRLLKDKRVVVEIKGENPITVGELADYMKQQLYHGVDRAVETKRLNKRKDTVLEEMLNKRVFRKEALRLGIDKTESYRSKVKEEENALIFGAFVKKAVAPEIKLKEEEIKAYYDQHIKEYTYPEMMKLNSLVFSKREDAEKALISLRKGTDYRWIKANTEGQVDKSSKGILDLDEKLLTTKDLPEEVRKAVSGAKTGDFRLFESPEKYFYVLSLKEVIPPKPQPYPEAREKIAKKIYGEKITKAVEDYADKIRAVSDVKIYLKYN
jgi:parvulin-like peptidyl-prolyl isomerase